METARKLPSGNLRVVGYWQKGQQTPLQTMR